MSEVSPRCPFCGKYVRLYWVDEHGTKKRIYLAEDSDGIAECRSCGQIDVFMEERVR